MVYFKASTGYQPGGPNIVAVGLPSQVDSSTLTSYELGLKSAFSDNRVFVDLVGYHIDWKDIQVASLVNGVSGLVNGGKASSDGLEAAITWRPIDGLTLGFTGSYNNSDLSEDFPTITVPAGPAVVEINTGLKGDRMPYVPDVTYAFTADYYLPLNGSWSMDIGGGYRWVDSRTNGTTQRQVVSLVSPPTVLTTDITPPLEIDSYQVLDLFAAVSNEHWTARVYMPTPKWPGKLAEAAPKFSSYALGWNVRDYRGERVIEHGGAIFGVYTYIALFPDRNFGVAFQMNSEDVQVMRGLALELIDQYLGAPKTDWISAFNGFLDARMQGGIAALDAAAKDAPKASGKPTLPMSSYAGRYADPWYGPIAITEEKGTLRLNFLQTPGLTGHLEHVHYDTFRTVWDNPDYEQAYMPPQMFAGLYASVVALLDAGARQRLEAALAAEPEGVAV